MAVVGHHCHCALWSWLHPGGTSVSVVVAIASWWYVVVHDHGCLLMWLSLMGPLSSMNDDNICGHPFGCHIADSDVASGYLVKTLENFNSQKDLSQHQACLMELMSQFDAKSVYIKGEDNSVADALSHLPCKTDYSTAEMCAKHPYDFCENDNTECTIACISLPSWHGPWETAKSLSSCPVKLQSINATLEITADKTFIEDVRVVYANDDWYKSLPSAMLSLPGLIFHDKLWYIGNQLIIL